MELYIMRATIEKNEDLTIARFLNGLNFAIRDIVELLPYNNLNDLVQMCIRVKQHLFRRPSHKDPSISYSKNIHQKISKAIFLNQKSLFLRIPQS